MYFKKNRKISHLIVLISMVYCIDAHSQLVLNINSFKLDTIWNNINPTIYKGANKYYMSQIKGKEPFRKIKKYLPKYYKKYISTLYLQNRGDYNRLDVSNGNLPHTQFNYFASNDSVAILSFNIGGNDFEFINLIFIKDKSKFKLRYAINFKDREFEFDELCGLIKNTSIEKHKID